MGNDAISFRDDGLMPENTKANCWLRACALPCGVECSSPCMSVRFGIPTESCLVCFTKLQNFLFAARVLLPSLCVIYLPDISSNPSVFSSGSCVSNLCIDLGRADFLSCVVSGMRGFFVGFASRFPCVSMVSYW